MKWNTLLKLLKKQSAGKRYTGYTKTKAKNPVKSRVTGTLDWVRLPSIPFENPSKIKGFRGSKNGGYTKRYTKSKKGEHPSGVLAK